MSRASAERLAHWPRLSAGKLVLLFAAIGLSIGLFATLRLAAVVAATPESLWFAENPRLVDPALSVAPSTQSRAEALARLLDEPSLIRGRLPACHSVLDPTADPGPAGTASDARCQEVIDAALRAAPSSGELWLFKAAVFVRSADIGAPAFAALRNSYRTAPREGWIASARVILGLRLWPFLPADLQASVRGDLALVLANDLAQPLADAYAGDFSLRRVAAPALQSLPKDLMDRFVSAVKSSVRSAAPAGSGD